MVQAFALAKADADS